MAQLRDTLIQGSARVTDTLYANLLKVTDIISAKQLQVDTGSDGTDHAKGIKFGNGSTYILTNTSGTMILQGDNSFYFRKTNNAPTGVYINPGTEVCPEGDGTIALGGTNKRWNGIYSTTGNFSNVIDIKPAGSTTTSEGGELHLNAATSATGQAGIVLNQYDSKFRIFGIASSDGTTKTGTGTPLVIDPYAKTITGGYTITGTLTGHASSDLALTGGKMTGRIYREGVASQWHKGRDNSLVAISTTNAYSPLASMKTTNGSWEIGVYDNTSFVDELLFTYVKDTTYNGSSAVADAQIRFYEDGGAYFTNRVSVTTGGIWVQGGSEAGSNNTRMALTAGMPDKFPYNSNKRGIFIYSNAIAFADPLNGNGNNDAGWIRHLEETANKGIFEIAVGDDNANEEIVVRRYNTSSTVGKEIKLFDTSGNTSFPGVVSLANQLTFTNTNAIQHIKFTRTHTNGGPSYICYPETGLLAIGFAEGYDNSIAVFDQKTALRPGKTNTYNLGASNAEWAHVYTPVLAAGSDSLIVQVGTASTTFTVAKFEGSSFLPGTTSARYIGSSTSPWTTVYTKYLITGVRETTTAPSVETEIDRIHIIPYYHTGGPFKIVSADDTANAYLKLKYGNTEILKVRHDGAFKNLWSLGVITGQYGMVSHICDAGGGTAGFFKFLTLTVTGAYTNRGVQISYSGRGRLGGIIYLGFANQNGTDPALTVQYTGDATIYYIKTTTSTWDLYINKSESYDSGYFTIINPSQIISGGVTWAWQNATVETLPAGYQTATIHSTKLNITGNAANVTGTVTATHGGTGITAYAVGDILYCSAANTLSKLAKGTAGQFLKMGTANVPIWGDGSEVTLNGTATTTPSFYAPADSGTVNYLLKSGGPSAAPIWDTNVSITAGGMLSATQVKAPNGFWVNDNYQKGNTTQRIKEALICVDSSNLNYGSVVYEYNANSAISRFGLYTYANIANNTTTNTYFTLEITDDGSTKRTQTDAKIYGAVWNDYAEYRKQLYEIEPGRVVRDLNSGHVVLTEERLIPGAQVVSDTFGFAIGETKECKTPLAVSGRVLVFTTQDRYKYNAGDAVCSGPHGTVDIMTREEIQKYPDAIVGIVSEIPTYDTWGQNEVAVQGRIWIKVR